MNRKQAIEMLTQIRIAIDELLAAVRDMNVHSSLAQEELSMGASELLVPMAQVFGALSARGVTDEEG